MKYNVKSTNFGKSLKDIVIENRGLTEQDVDFLVNPTKEFVEMPLKIKNIDTAIKLFINEVEDRTNTIGLLVDSDVDGSTSSALMYLFLINECEYPKDKIKIYHHEGKQHGINDKKVFKQIKKDNIDFLIIPDAGTNDIKEIKELLSIGKKILVLDHHQVEKHLEEDYKSVFKNPDGKLLGVVVNNQFDVYSNALSGVGVVYKFLTAMTEDELEHYMDLVAIGSIADSMNINDKELRYIVKRGLNNITNEFFKELFQSDEEVTPKDISFNVANKINAVHRYGKQQEKIDMFRALIGEQEDIPYKPRKSKTNPNPQEEIHSLQKTMARICGNVKTRQDKAVKESIKKIEQYIEEHNCDEHKVIVVRNEEKGKNSLIERNIGGLVANKLREKYKKPIMIIHNLDTTYEGSMRGYGVESFADILHSTGIVETKGHLNSAGVCIKKSDMPRLLKRLDKAMEDIEIQESGYEVDCEIKLNELTPKDFDDLYNMRTLWFSDCPEPMFLIRDMEVPEKDMLNPNNFKTLLSFKYDGYKFDRNFCSGEFLDRVLFRNEKRFGRVIFKVDAIVKLSKNEYNKNGYFEVVDLDTTIIGKSNNTKNDNCPF